MRAREMHEQELGGGGGGGGGGGVKNKTHEILFCAVCMSELIRIT
jgi:hypothetical protein